MEIELYSNIRFMNFLDYPESVTDARTIWLFGEKMAKTTWTGKYGKRYGSSSRRRE